MNSWLKVLPDALDLVEYGVVYLDETLTARFVNRAFCRIWGLPETAPATPYTFEALERHGKSVGIVRLTVGDLPSRYVRHRMSLLKADQRPPVHLRLPDDRIIRVESRKLEGGGRYITYTDETLLIRSIEQMQELASTDELTKVLNRRFFYSTGQTEVERARRYRHPLSVLLLYPDNFQRISDTYGPAAADRVIAHVARCCRDNVRETDHVGRLRGEEIGITLIEAPFAAAIKIAEKLCRKIATVPLRVGQVTLSVTASFGVATLTDGVSEFSELLRKADEEFGSDRALRRRDEGLVAPERRSYPAPAACG